MYALILVYFTVFLKNRNISSKIKRSKVTDYAALRANRLNAGSTAVIRAKDKVTKMILELLYIDLMITCNQAAINYLVKCIQC